jgi:hypothetical protein
VDNIFIVVYVLIRPKDGFVMGDKFVENRSWKKEQFFLCTTKKVFLFLTPIQL